jgi:hypothetical protein
MFFARVPSTTLCNPSSLHVAARAIDTIPK